MARVKLSEVRSIEWGASYLWDAEFPHNPPSDPFDKVFPATEIQMTHADISTHSFAIGSFAMNVPSSREAAKVSITFLDDEAGTMFDYIRTWYDQVANKIGVQPVGQASRAFTYKKYLKRNPKDPIEERDLFMFPSGSLVDASGSNSDAKQFTATFEVVYDKVTRHALK